MQLSFLPSVATPPTHGRSLAVSRHSDSLKHNLSENEKFHFNQCKLVWIYHPEKRLKELYELCVHRFVLSMRKCVVVPGPIIRIRKFFLTSDIIFYSLLNYMWGAASWRCALNSAALTSDPNVWIGKLGIIAASQMQQNIIISMDIVTLQNHVFRFAKSHISCRTLLFWRLADVVIKHQSETLFLAYLRISLKRSVQHFLLALFPEKAEKKIMKQCNWECIWN